MSNLANINRVYSPTKFLNEEEQIQTGSRARSAKSRSDSDNRGSESFYSRSHSQASSFEENVDDYYPKSPLQNHDVLSIINKKIAKLDEVLHDFRNMRVESRSSNYESIRPISSTKAKHEANKKEKENKEIHQFAGIYSLKSVFYDTKITVPEVHSTKDESSITNKPKLIELYQYPGYEDDIYTPLAHNVKVNDVLEKTLNSINILNKQPKYKVFLRKMVFTDEYKCMVCDVFWYIFLEKYQKGSQKMQQSLFERLSKNYVSILMMTLDPLYKETFYKNFANLLAMTVYAAFCTCFPESYTHFGHEFKEFICNICHLWVNGNKPVPRSYMKWNFKMLDPPQAIFAEEVLTNKNKMEHILNFESNEPSERVSELKRDSAFASSSSRFNNYTTLNNKTQSMSILSTRKAAANEPKPVVPKIKKYSNVAGKGPEFEDSLFDLYGRSPLVDCFLYKQNSRKLNTFETLVSHPTIISLPPLDGQTYDDVIAESLKATRKIENGYKNLVQKHKKDATKLANEHAKAMKALKKNEKLLLSKQKDVKYLGDLISMEAKKDAKSTSVGADLALLKALKIE